MNTATALPRALRRAACALLCAAATAAALAAPMPNAARPLTLTAREQPVAAFLQNLFASVDVPAVISPQLAGSVNGNFSGPAERVLRDVARVYNLVTYYDGAAMHVVPASELVNRSQALAPAAAERVMREAQALGLPDARNTLRLTAGSQLVISGTKRFAEQVDELIRAAQSVQAAAAAPAVPGQMDFKVFYLRYAWAQDTTVNLGGRQIVVPGVASILRSLVGSGPAGAGAQNVALRPTLPKLKGQGLSSQGVAPTAGERNKESADAARGRAVDALVNALNSTAAPANEAPAASTPAGPAVAYDPRQISIEAEPRLNAIIVRDVSERLARYEQLIAALDVEPQSLEIEATIIDVNTDRLRELGVNWRWNNAGNSASFGNLAAGTLGRGGVATTVLGSLGQFIARINALQAEGAARVVSSPQVVTLSNVEAVFDNTSTFFVRVAGRQEVDLFNVSAGTSLRVTPHVFRDQEATRIKLLVNVEDGALTGQQVDQIPIVERSSINTQALIAEGESLLIGGMTREVNSANVDKVPGLGDVPVVGNLFKNKTSSSARIERMFLITPRLANSRPAPTNTALQPAVPPVAAAPAAGARYTPERAPVEIDLDAMAPGR